MADLHPLYFEVETLVRDHVASYAERYRIRFSASAVSALLERGESYDFGVDAAIQGSSLSESLDEIFANLADHRDFRGVVTRREMQAAMSRATCHYLWFC